MTVGLLLLLILNVVAMSNGLLKIEGPSGIREFTKGNNKTLTQDAKRSANMYFQELKSSSDNALRSFSMDFLFAEVVYKSEKNLLESSIMNSIYKLD
jgi:hypothetical protein